MNAKQIQALLEERYTRERWKELIEEILPGREIFKVAIPSGPETESEREKVKAIVRFGEVRLAEHETIGLYEAELQPGVDIARSRVVIRGIVEKYVKWTGLNGALISFFSPQEDAWRFSFYSVGLDDNLRLKDRTHRRRFTYLLGKGEKCRTAAEQFAKLLEPGGAVSLEDLKAAFSVEKVGDDFFEEYREHYQRFVHHLTGKRYRKQKGKWIEVTEGPTPVVLARCFNGDRKAARDFCKKLLGRIVFLHFLQKKRWLGASTKGYTDGSLNFILELFKTSGANDAFYTTWLRDLFFSTLNQSRSEDMFKLPDGKAVKVPFLNGGLFDKDDLDRRTEMLTIQPELFAHPDRRSADEPKERGFLDFLAAYNFTVDESAPNDETLAVDPEMLGHIFENLLEDNKDKGTFYTPKEIVHYMCRESLTQYLINYLKRNATREVEPETEDHIRNLITEGAWRKAGDHSGALLKALYDLRVCDPAIGSGAFPMGILYAIVHALEKLEDLSPDEFSSTWKMDGWDAAKVKMRIIQHSIYGVDIERGAVDIARLRFWLSIIVNEDVPHTLPNLDYKIVVGDSLLGKFSPGTDTKAEVCEIDWQITGGTDRAKEIRGIIEQLHEKTDAFFEDKTQDEKEALGEKIRGLKIELLTKQLELVRDRFKARMLPAERIWELTPREQVLVSQQQQQLAGYENWLTKLRALAKTKEKQLDYFDWQLDFPEVMNPNETGDPGFDIVIANPPYMRVQQVQQAMPEFKHALEAKYKNAKGAWDLANIFFERAVQLVKQNGNCCFIFPHKFFNSDSAGVFRDYLMAGAYVDRILHFGANQVFNEADTYTCIAQFSKAHNTGFMFSKVPFKQSKGTYIDWFAPYLNSTGHFNVINYSSLERASKVYGGNTWIFFKRPEEYETFEQLYDRSVRLADVFEDVFQGIATSKDELYIGELLADSGKHLELSFGEYGNHKVEKALFKPMLKGSDVHRYETLNHSKYVFFPYLVDQKKDKAAIVDLKSLKRDYPLTHRYVSLNEVAFKKRESGKAARMEHWHGYIYPKNLTKFDKVKLSSMEICSSHGNVTLNNGKIYHNTKVYSWVIWPHVRESYEYFLALLNSKVMWWFVYNTGDTLQGDARTFKTNYVNPFPLPRQVGRKRDEFMAERVKRIMEEKRQGRSTTALEAEIDVLVCKLYGLSWEQAKVVDPQLALSKEAYDAVELPEAEGPSGNVVSEPGVTGLTDEGTLFGQKLDEPPPKRATSRAPESAPSNGQASGAFLKFLRANSGWHGKSAILEGSGVSADAWNPTIKQLLEDGKVERQGEKKGAKYKAS